MKTDAKAVEAALRCGADFIISQQQADGNFLSLSSTSLDDFTGAKTLPAIFLTSAALAALHAVELPELEAVKNRGAAYLWQQKGGDWSFNYWQRGSEQAQSQPYPDDLDDTFCALAALLLQDVEPFDGKALAAIAQLLMAAEKQPGGPYRTWLAQAKTGAKWGDIDLAVNANIGWFLTLQNVQVPGIVQLVERAITRDAFTSPYYPSEAVPLYFIARWYRGKRQTALLDAVRTRLEATAPSDALGTAALVSSVLRLGADKVACTPYVESLLELQYSDGSWPAAAYCLDPAMGNTTYYAGSSALTTALCLETLGLYAHTLRSRPQAKQDTTYSQAVRDVAKSVSLIKQPSLRRSVDTALHQVLTSGNQQQIIQLPYVIAQAMDLSVPNQTLRQLATANLWGWAAYTVCDDFLDGAGKPDLLPGATTALRYLHTILAATMPKNHGFQQEVQVILERIDAANAWEITHCRGEVRDGRLYVKKLPNYGRHWQLADRSLGHTIAGLGVLYAAGLPEDAPQLVALRTFFRHYLITRQLNDDAHDWQEDLRYGHINATGVLVIQHWLTTTNSRLVDGIVFDDTQQALQNSMWESAIDQVAQQIFRHTNLARRAITRSGFKTEPFEAMLAPLDAAAGEALTARQNTRDFLDNL